MIACLPMYDWPEVRGATDSLWRHIATALRGHGVSAPKTLTRNLSPTEAWARDDLLLSQTCSLPFRRRFHERLTIVGTPDHVLEHTPAGHYRSVVVVAAGAAGARPEEFPTLALNGPDSQSGWAALAATGYRPSAVVPTGTHRDSARAVADGRADIAAIDAVAWRFLSGHEARTAARLRILLRTEPTPGLPLVTARADLAPRIRAALSAAYANLPEEVATMLHLRGLVHIPERAYLDLPIPPSPP